MAGWLRRVLRRRARTNHVITLTTDFGTGPDPGALLGVIHAINSKARVATISHGIRPHQVREAAHVLRTTAPYYPYAVHVGIVFPTVGTPHARSLVVACRRGLLVGPDNGILMPAARELELEAVYEVSSPERWLSTPSNAFSAVETYGSLAAYLSRGLPPHVVGPPVYGYIELEPPKYVAAEEGLEGEIITIDPFGNLITSIPGRAIAPFAGYNDLLELVMDGRSVRLPLLKSYGYAPKGSILATLNRHGMLAIAAYCDSAARLLEVETLTSLRVFPVPSETAET